MFHINDYFKLIINWNISNFIHTQKTTATKIGYFSDLSMIYNKKNKKKVFFDNSMYCKSDIQNRIN